MRKLENDSLFGYEQHFKRKRIIVLKRSEILLKLFQGRIVYVHNGKKFFPIFITHKKIGQKAGSFVLTRVFPNHLFKKKSRKKRNKKG